jgi:hypothetical protein
MARRTTKPSLPCVQIKTPALPGSIFFGLESLHDGSLDRALEEKRAIEEYKVDGCREALWDALHDLGWSDGQIEAVEANPVPLATGYGWTPAVASLAA